MPYIPVVPLPALDEHSQGRRMSNSVTNALAPLMNKNKPAVDIALDDEQKDAFVPSFTTLEKIQGTVSVTCPADTQFQDLHIIFQGSVKTFVEKVVTAAPTQPRTQAYHNFLRLTQPMENSDLPEDKVAKAGVTYRLPFTFVVPERLLPQACTHHKDNSAVSEAHVQLPPSLGDPMMASDGKSLLDDMAPNMTVISYGIRVVITKKAVKASGSSRPMVIADAMKKLRIIPAAEEQPPLRVSEENEESYILSKSKRLKKGIFKGKLGTLTMSAPQPSPLRLPYIKSTSDAPAATMATVDLRFDPSDASSKPPRLGQLWVKLKVATFFATNPLRSFPSKASTYIYDSQRGMFVDTLPLSSRNVESAQWTRHLTPPSSPTDNTPTLTLPFYTSQLLVPVSLPTTQSSYKSFAPTFHSCLASRIYTLDLVLAAHSPSSTVGSTSIHIKLPLQITSTGNVDARPVISDEEAASIARREADMSYAPRNVAPPPEAVHEGDVHGARGSVFSPPRWGSVGSYSSAEEDTIRRGSAVSMGGAMGAVMGGEGRRGSAATGGRGSPGPERRPSFALGTWDERREGEEGGLRNVAEEASDEPPGYTSFQGRRA